MSVARTNIRPVTIPPPRTFDERSLRAWTVAVAQALRFNRVARATTVGASSSVILDVQTEDATVYGLKGYVVGRRTAGSGSLNDGYFGIIRGTYKVVSGTLSEVGETLEFEVTDIVGATIGMAPNDAKIELSVTGASGYEITWFAFLQTLLST